VRVRSDLSGVLAGVLAGVQAGVLVAVAACVAVFALGAFLGSFALGSSAGIAAAVAALALVEYRGRRDPTVALVGAACGVYAILSITTGITADALAASARDRMFASAQAPLLSVETDGWYDAIRAQVSIGVFGALPGLGGIAAALASVVPWRDRRGRRPLEPTRAIVAIAVPVAAAYAWLLVAKPIPPGSDVETVVGEIGRGRGAVRVLAAIVVAVALVAAGRMFARRRHGWLAGSAVAAALAASAGFVSTFASEETALKDGAFAVAASLPAVATGLLLIALLSAVRLETSRLRRSSDRAEEVLEGRAEIASMIAHEVRGPISTIKGLAATTSGSYDKLSDEERREFVGLIDDEAARLLDIVDKTSLALRIDAATLSFDPRRHDLADVVLDGIGGADVTGREVTTTLAAGLTAEVDRRWLAFAIRQGVDNAARFSPPGAPIDVTLRRERDAASIEIGDRGPGVPAERLEEVFGRFARWRPTGYEDRQGSGLGLFICRGILAEHAGDASLEARPEGGTMLRLTIPLDEPPTEG
jgi:signal transduction histidine kinase